MTTDQISLSTADARLVELAALRAEVDQLRLIAAAAEYLEAQPGHSGCIGDRDCDEYTDDGVDLCSHVQRHHATYAHVAAHTRLASLLVDVQRQLLDLLGADDVLTTIREGLYAIVVDFNTDVDPGADLVTAHPVYVTAVEDTDERITDEHA